MSEESSPPEEAPRKRSVSKSAKKKTARVTENAEAPAAKPSKSSSEKIPKAEQSDSEARPATKRGVRGPKKSAAKKSSNQQAEKSSDASDSRESQQDSGKQSQSGQSGASQGAGDQASKEDTNQNQPRRGRNRNRSRQDKPQPEETKVKLDTKLVAKRAWKIYLGEVNEEGLALIADKDARELARRSLRVAEIYTQEEAVSLQRVKKQKGPKVKKEAKPEKSADTDQ